MARHNSKRSALPRGYGLRDFAAFLIEVANDGVSDKRLTMKERARMRMNAKLLDDAIAELGKVLTDQQRRTLYQALASTCIIANHLTHNPVASRLHTAPATAARLEKKRTTRDIVAALAGGYPDLGPYRIASIIVGEVNKELGAKRRRPIKPDTIARMVAANQNTGRKQ